MPSETEAENEALLQEAELAFARGDLKAAFDLCRRGVEADLREARFYFLAAQVASRRGEARQAGEFAAHAAALKPDDALYTAYLAKCFAALDRAREAKIVAERAEKLGPADAQSWDMLGYVFSKTGAYDRALAAFERAVALEPNAAPYWLNVASAQIVLGNVEAATRAYEKTIALNRDFIPAYLSLVQLRRQTPASNHVAKLEELLARSEGSVDNTLQIGHALAKSHEDLGEYDKALAALARAKAPARRATGFSIDRERAAFEAAARAHDGKPAAAGHPTEAPIFVLGLPRTGTTLVERIVSSHPDVVSVGELLAFPTLVRQIGAPTARAYYSAELFEAARTMDVAMLGRSYEEKARAIAGASAPRFLDKLPFNFLYAGLINRALPNARIICLRRDPMDSVLSNYRQMFGPDQPLYHYAFDLEDTAREFVLFDRLIAHWRATLPPDRFTECAYEKLVASQEAETRRLIAFCGLSWDPRCLAFHENEAPVATASSAQVREPINTRSIGRWKRYGGGVDPARRILSEAGLLVS